MTACTVDRCDELVEKKGHTLCYPHWQAEKAGELTECKTCGRLKEDAKPLCSSCFKESKATPNPSSSSLSTLRRAGQGAREIADQLAKANPLGMLLSKMTLGVYRAPGYSWRVGAKSEEEVGRELLKLPPGWFVRHDIMIGQAWNADHVVVGPAGAFVLDTKFRSGQVKTSRAGIRVDGRKTNMAEKTQEQAREISARLREAAGMRNWVQPVLVFDNDVRGKRDPDGVHVVGLSLVVDYLTEMPRELDDDEVQHVGSVLHDDATWPFANAPTSEAGSFVDALSRKERFRTAWAIVSVWAALLFVAALRLPSVPFFKGMLVAAAPLAVLKVVERFAKSRR